MEFGSVILRWVSANLWEIYETMEVKIDDKAIFIPKGFKTDLASIPRALWPILSPMGSYTPAAVFHDYLYKVQPCTKDEADEYLLEGMVALGVDETTSSIIYTAVKDFGHSAWNNHTEEQLVGVVTPEGGHDAVKT